MHSHDRTMLARLGFADPDKKNPIHDLACQYVALPENATALVAHTVLVRQVPVARTYTDHCKLKGTVTMTPEFSRAELEVPISKGEGQYKTTIGFLDVALRFDYATVEEGNKEWVATLNQMEHWGEWGPLEFRWYQERQDLKTSGTVQLLKQGQAARDRIAEIEMNVMTIEHHYVHDPRSAAFSSHENPSRHAICYPYCRCCRDTCPCRKLLNEIATARSTPLIHSGPHLTTKHAPGGSVYVEVKTTPVGAGELLRQINLYRGYVDGHWVIATTFPISQLDAATLERAEIRHVMLGNKFQAWLTEYRTNQAAATNKSVEI